MSHPHNLFLTPSNMQNDYTCVPTIPSYQTMPSEEPTAGTTAEADSGRKSKVARNIRDYDLEGLGAELERLWTDSDDRYSLRDLADHFNYRLLESEMEAAEMDPLQGEIENIYHLLTDDDISSGRRVKARRRLERGGVDVETLEQDFVSHQAIHTYLTSYRGASFPDDERSPIERETTKLTRLQNRVSIVTEDAVSRLADSGQVNAEEFDVFVDVSILCRQCGSTYALEEFLESGGCDCE